jgi:histidinol-phosphate aminotransferase
MTDRSIDGILRLARPEILALEPYRHASADHSLQRLHANESPWPPPFADDGAGGTATGAATGTPLNRYPPPQPRELSTALGRAWGVEADQILIGRGSDEGIDLLTRAFCAAARDRVVLCPPTFGMYAVAARIQGAAVQAVPLRAEDGFSLDVPGIVAAIDAGAKIVWLCTPNNPTGNALHRRDIETLLDASAGRALLVVDEAYAEFSDAPPWTLEVARHPQLVTLRTLSKAHGLAGARVGAVVAHPEIIALLRRIVPPYAVPGPTLDAALAALTPATLAVTQARVLSLIAERQRLATGLSRLAVVRKVWPSDANFLLVDFDDAGAALGRLHAAGVLVRDFRGYHGLGEALRLTVGTPGQNDLMLRSLA